MNYHGLMTKTLLAAALGTLLMLPVFAQPVDADKPAPTLEAERAKASAIESSPLDAQLFYQLLIGELNASAGEPAAAVSLLLDAARRTKDVQLFKRATDLALESRSGDAALQAARAWRQTFPASADAHRYVLQILLALNRIPESAEALKLLISVTPEAERAQILAGVPRLFARVGDKKLAAVSVEQALVPSVAASATASSAWTTIGRMRLLANDNAGALEAARRAQAADGQSDAPALLALELMEAKADVKADPKGPQAEALVRNYLAAPRSKTPEVRMAYARTLLDAKRYADALTQLQALTLEKPDNAQAWLVLGSLQAQENQPGPADTSLQRYITLAQSQSPSTDTARGLAQAYLALAQLAEKRKDFSAADAWLKKIESPDAMLQAQTQRATLLGRQGRLQEGLALLRALPERRADDTRNKLLAEVSLLREFKQYRPAFELMAKSVAESPQDIELIYEQAMLAEKLALLSDMERLLRQVIAIKPDYYAAYNALGYSLADRNLRLPEAKQLIQKALEFAPTDPFIQDSLGWVEFRLGNRTEALRILEAAFKARPDAEIAAHLGEVLWSLGQRGRAQAIWKEGLLINAENETLLETLKRLRVTP